ncbi:hypothetical protein QL285_083491 [Trifolium repens]|nr:hypothetical protein QL285_083491 [Trifolium repens]
MSKHSSSIGTLDENIIHNVECQTVSNPIKSFTRSTAKQNISIDMHKRIRVYQRAKTKPLEYFIPQPTSKGACSE